MRILKPAILILFIFGAYSRLCFATVVDAYAYMNPEKETDLYKVTAETTPRDNGTISMTWQDGPHTGTSDKLYVEKIYYVDKTETGLKSGDEIYSVDAGLKMKILGVNLLHQFGAVIESGSKNGQTVHAIHRADIAVPSGCVGSFCVGQQQEVPVKGELKNVKLVALDVNNKFIGWSQDNDPDPIVGITADFILKTDGCNLKANICANKFFYHEKNKYIIKVLGFTETSFYRAQVVSGSDKGKIVELSDKLVPLGGNCREDLCPGTTYLNMYANFSPVKILAFLGDARNTLVDSTSDMSEVKELDSAWLVKEKRTCNMKQDLCVGQEVTQVSSNSTDTFTVAGVQRNEQFILKSKDNYFLYNQPRYDLAMTRGCDSEKKFCVGHTYYVNTAEHGLLLLKLTGLRVDGAFKALSTDGYSSLYPEVNAGAISTSGCHKSICYEKDFPR